MIAHVVFDLPIDGPFDYSIPDALKPHVTFGTRVKVHFGPRVLQGFVIGTAATTDILKIKPIKKTIDQTPIFDERDMDFARQFSRYYATTLGEALSMMTRHRRHAPVPSRNKHSQAVILYHCIDGKYDAAINEVKNIYKQPFMLVADAYAAKGLEGRMPLGLRSSMFSAFTQSDCIVVLDEDNASFKQEQSPQYETRQVVLMAQKVYGFDVVFISLTPSVDLIHLKENKSITYNRLGNCLPQPMVIDLTNYKFLDKGILSVPVRNALESNIKSKQKTLVFFNRKGSLKVTRCKQCGFVLKCARCDSFLSLSQSKGSFVCQHCLWEKKEAGDCPTCEVPSWESFGFGIEKVQKEIAKLFPTANIALFQGATAALPTHYDVLIATAAILRFEKTLVFQTVAVIDVDTPLNRVEIRSSFKVWAMLLHLQRMAKSILVQTRNIDHPIFKSFLAQDDQMFYTRELEVRKELGFAPYYHWVAVVVRSKVEKNANTYALDVYNYLKALKGQAIKVTDVAPDVPAKLRDQFRFKLLVGGDDVVAINAHIKTSLANIKRVSGVLVTVNIDP